jgi:lipoprotein-releasing system permease protein
MADGAAPFGYHERALAMRYLRAKRSQGGVAMISIISVVGIMLAVGVLVITMSVMNGFRETMLSRILGVNGHVYVDTANQTPEEVARLAAIARTVPGVVHVAPIIEGQVLAVLGAQASGAYVRGISKADLSTLPIVSKNLAGGNLDHFYTDADGMADVVVGYRLANRLGALNGEPITLISPQGAVTPFGVTPRRKAYNVGAQFNVGMAEYDAAFVYMPLEEAQLFFGRVGPDRLEIRVDDPDQTIPIMQTLRAKLGPELYISDWKDQNASLVTALVVERNVMRLILMAVVVLATLNIITGLVMLVKNKARDIAILRTMGVTKGGITRIFMMAGGTLGILGTITGVVAATLFCLYIGPIQDLVSTVTRTNVFNPEVYSLSRIPAKVEWSEIALISVFSMGFSLLAAFLPAWWASRFDPVEALRYE